MKSGKKNTDPSHGMSRLLHIVALLRGKNGCPWDRKQTLRSIKHNLIEECYELVEAVDSGDKLRHIEELGDVLLQVLLQTQIRSERGHFSFDDVARTLADKLVRRHPHVFGRARVSDARQVLKNWEKLKAGERSKVKCGSVLDGIPRSLPAMAYAHRVQTALSRVGYDWKRVSEVVAKVQEELGETRRAISRRNRPGTARELGDLFFAAVNLSRFLGLDAESLLRDATRRCASRVRAIEAALRRRGRTLHDCNAAELDRLWEDAKRAEIRRRRRTERAPLRLLASGGRCALACAITATAFLSRPSAAEEAALSSNPRFSTPISSPEARQEREKRVWRQNCGGPLSGPCAALGGHALLTVRLDLRNGANYDAHAPRIAADERVLDADGVKLNAEKNLNWHVPAAASADGPIAIYRARSSRLRPGRAWPRTAGDRPWSRTSGIQPRPTSPRGSRSGC